MFVDLERSVAKLSNHRKEEKRLLKVLQKLNGRFPERLENQTSRLHDLQSRIIPANEREVYELETGARVPRTKRPVLW